MPGCPMSPHFARVGHADVQMLIARHPLAWIVAPGAPAAAASLLPLLGRYATDGTLITLVGHMSRRNPLARALADAPLAYFLFTGPQGYVSPEHSGRRDWAPTWNYAALRIEAEVKLDADYTREAVEDLVDACEAGRAEPWTSAELGTRHEPMLARIIGFEARVTALQGTFKLGQDEPEEVFEALLTRHPDAELQDWMRRANADRRE